MIENLIVHHQLKTTGEVQLPIQMGDLLIETCQRYLLISWDSTGMQKSEFRGETAYRLLLEICCGLRSRLIAEQEVTRQFKDALQQYLQRQDRLSEMILIMEKLLKDTKNIRHLYLQGLGQSSYAGLCRKILKESNHQGDVLIIGSGNLALDLKKVLAKHFTLFFTARDLEKAATIAENGQVVPWMNFKKWSSFSAIVNTIGHDGPAVFDPRFFQSWNVSGPIFVDLGSPSIVNAPSEFKKYVIQLDDLLEKARNEQVHKTHQVNLAQTGIDKIVAKRRSIFLNSPSRGNVA